MNPDLKIAQSAKLRHIDEIASGIQISPEKIDHYGNYKAKLSLDLIDPGKMEANKLVLVTAMTPTRAGEGKTTVSIGLSQGINKIGKKSIVVLREPSLGPVFGIKGGAAGGGYSQVLPMEDINLHFTGDLSAIEKANNLLSALIDNRLHRGIKSPDLNPRTIQWKRVMDVNDRSLRYILTGLGDGNHGVPIQTGFNITAASEVMAIFCLANDLQHLKEKLGNIFIGYTFDKTPVFARDMKAQGAMAALLKDAIRPNLVQTIEHTPAIIHGGPFANIAHGCNSLIATKMGLSVCNYVVTEAGFASDLGAEKFFHIHCRYGGLKPHAVVIVATVRALKLHGGQPYSQLHEVDPESVRKGLPNLKKHIENMEAFGLNPIVAVNKFNTDAQNEHAVILDACNDWKIKASLSDGWTSGGDGTTDLAALVVEEADRPKNHFQFLYNTEELIADKIEKIATKIYGADEVQFELKARRDMEKIEKLGLGNLPVCIAKTQNSLSDNPRLLGRPEGFKLRIREMEVSAGAGFIIPIAGDIMRMPGLGKLPAAESIDINSRGEIEGLF